MIKKPLLIKLEDLEELNIDDLPEDAEIIVDDYDDSMDDDFWDEIEKHSN